MPTPNIVVAVNTNVFKVSCSPSIFAKKSAITGDVLKRVHPNPIGNILKTFCCNRIPIFVPKNVAVNSIILFLKDNLEIELNRSFLIKGHKTRILPINLITVVWNGLKSEFIKTNLDKVAANTAENTESKA